MREAGVPGVDVLVIGGGNAALNAAIAARQAGGSVRV
jgi:succinate dehydrogenase/fumarate reductase flavoprotein subunit